MDPGRGLLTGDLCRADLPTRPPYRFLLHRALTIESVRTGAGRVLAYAGYADLAPVGRALRYTVEDTLDHAPGAPARLCVRYTGAFPVYDSVPNTFDSRENLAFGYGTVRATHDTHWYPVLVDSAPGAPARERAVVTYHVRMRCAGCRTIYLNGAAPAPGPEAEFASARPRELFLYAGDVPATTRGGMTYVGAPVSDAAARAFGGKAGALRRFYGEFLGVPFGDTLVFLSFRPVKAMRVGQLWAFYTTPTIAVNKPFDLMVDPTVGPWMLDATFGILAHEAAHYYFGGVLRPVGPYRPFYVESTAEYLAMKAQHRLLGDSAYRARLRAHAAELAAGAALPPLDSIAAVATRGPNPLAADRYRYAYGPLLLVGLERAVGEPVLRRALAALLSTPEGTALDYAALRRAVLGAGAPAAAWARFEQDCVRAAPGAACLSAPGA